jgi:hypothetical protein
MSVGLAILVLSNPYERLSLCVIAKTALAVVATPLLTSTQTLTTHTTLTTGRKVTPLMNEYYADEDVFFDDDEPLTPEEQAAADRAYYRQQEQEAYAEFLQSPYCFD